MTLTRIVTDGGTVLTEQIAGWLQEGLGHYSAGRPHQAIDAWLRILAVDPTHALALQYIDYVRQVYRIDVVTPGSADIAAATPGSAPAPASPAATAAVAKAFEHPSLESPTAASAAQQDDVQAASVEKIQRAVFGQGVESSWSELVDSAFDASPAPGSERATVPESRNAGPSPPPTGPTNPWAPRPALKVEEATPAPLVPPTGGTGGGRATPTTEPIQGAAAPSPHQGEETAASVLAPPAPPPPAAATAPPPPLDPLPFLATPAPSFLAPVVAAALSDAVAPAEASMEVLELAEELPGPPPAVAAPLGAASSQTENRPIVAPAPAPDVWRPRSMDLREPTPPPFDPWRGDTAPVSMPIVPPGVSIALDIPPPSGIDGAPVSVSASTPPTTERYPSASTPPTTERYPSASTPPTTERYPSPPPSPAASPASHRPPSSASPPTSAPPPSPSSPQPTAIRSNASSSKSPFAAKPPSTPPVSSPFVAAQVSSMSSTPPTRSGPGDGVGLHRTKTSERVEVGAAPRVASKTWPPTPVVPTVATPAPSLAQPELSKLELAEPELGPPGSGAVRVPSALDEGSVDHGGKHRETDFAMWDELPHSSVTEPVKASQSFLSQESAWPPPPPAEPVYDDALGAMDFPFPSNSKALDGSGKVVDPWDQIDGASGAVDLDAAPLARSKLGAVVGVETTDIVDAWDAGSVEPAVPPEDECTALMRSARELFDLGDFSGSLDLVEKVLKLDPRNEAAQAYLARNEQTLTKMYESKLGSLSARPRQMMPPDEVIWMSMHHKAGFILSQVDGQLSFEDIVEISAMPRFETMRILADLVRQGIIK